MTTLPHLPEWPTAPASLGLTGLLETALRYATPETLGLLILWNDPQSRRLRAAKHLEVVRAALAEGQALATDLRDRFGDLPPDGMAKALGLVLRETNDDPVRGGVLFYAEYCEKTSEILLFRQALRLLRTGLDEETAARHFKPIDLMQLFVAHELYHYAAAAARRYRPNIARRQRVTIAKLGPWRWRSGLASLEEIAAGSCAQALLRLTHHPKMLDLITLRQLDPATATAMVTALREASLAIAKASGGAPGASSLVQKNSE
jgi:hypothetical protein